MKPRVIQLPKGSVPERVIPHEADTVSCHCVRMGFYLLSGISYTVLVVSWWFGWVDLNNAQATVVGFTGLMIPLIGDRLIRPGKGKLWMITLLVVLLMLIPFVGFCFLVLLPLGLLAHRAVLSMRVAHRGGVMTGED